jgi:hypothetical protein
MTADELFRHVLSRGLVDRLRATEPTASYGSLKLSDTRTHYDLPGS